MRKLFLISLVSAALVVAGQPAFADHRGHGYYKQHHYKGHHKRHHYKHHRKHRRHHGHHHHRKRKGVDGDDLIVAAGILGGAVVLGSILSRPSYAAPAPQSYAPAPAYRPPRQPYCVVDDVYRYLPDGRIQWGERTTCYWILGVAPQTPRRDYNLMVNPDLTILGDIHRPAKGG